MNDNRIHFEIPGDLTQHRVCIPLLLRRGEEQRLSRRRLIRSTLILLAYLIGCGLGVFATWAQGGQP